MMRYTPRTPYPPDWFDIAETIRAEANWQCEHCGAQGLTPEQYPEWERPDLRTLLLEVHHKDRNPANCARDNLIALCRRCHRAEHRRLRQAAQLELLANAEVPQPDQSVQDSERAGHPGERAELQAARAGPG